ncbi:hypothetical protein GCM10011390_08680 [Aureimonas endophytica]|uniref:Toxin ParE1/3/4 n=1 Tax=Aureimonas endophytica TaxID=2027858 RepID=A0A916ZE89_9HYPH|nr:type II toxin-antitoxin system RelE/ParE family toxin [Aureimonas endophytica]GGD92242.1 hypothetical protein GCM10011390_08680 [Aureimonas endophytica]
MRPRLTRLADEDIAEILAETLHRFGPNQFGLYADLIQKSLDLLADDPFALTTVPRDALAPGLRMLALGRLAWRRDAAAHCVYYVLPLPGRRAETVVLRVLHERMEPAAWLSRGFDEMAS